MRECSSQKKAHETAACPGAGTPTCREAPFMPVPTAVLSRSPSPAPSLDDINSLQSGTNLFLSFGSSNDQSSASPAYVSVAGTAGISSAVDVNGAYNITTSSNNIRLGASIPSSSSR